MLMPIISMKIIPLGHLQKIKVLPTQLCPAHSRVSCAGFLWAQAKKHGLWNSIQQLLLNNWQNWSFRAIKSIGNLKYLVSTRLKRGGSCSNTRCPFITLRTKLYLYYLTVYLNTTLHYLAKHTLFFCDKTPRTELTLHFHQTLNTFTEALYRHRR